MSVWLCDLVSLGRDLELELRLRLELGLRISTYMSILPSHVGSLVAVANLLQHDEARRTSLSCRYIETYIHIFPHISTYIHKYTHMYTYIHIYTNIFTTRRTSLSSYTRKIQTFSGIFGHISAAYTTQRIGQFTNKPIISAMLPPLTRHSNTSFQN